MKQLEFDIDQITDQYDYDSKSKIFVNLDKSWRNELILLNTIFKMKQNVFSY